MTKHSKILALFLGFSFILALAAVAQQAEETVVCPVSGKEMKKSEAKVAHEYQGKTYYFGCEKCKEEFVKDPEKYAQKKEETKAVYTCPMHPEVKSDKPGKCPECGMKLEKKMVHKEKMMLKEEMEQREKMHVHMHKQVVEEHCCLMMDMMSHEEIDMNFENIEKGIAVKITSKNAEVVKKIQEMAANMKECCQKEIKKEVVKKEVIKN